MQENHQTTLAPTAGSNVGPGSPNATWSNPSRVTADDASSAEIAFTIGGQDSDWLVGNAFNFSLPDAAIIDGVEIHIDGAQNGCIGDVTLGVAGSESKDAASLNETYGSSTDLWGLDEITLADLTAIDIGIHLLDLSGGDGFASVDHMTMTIHWHLDPMVPAAQVPTRVAYKSFSRDGTYLGELPNVTSKFGFSQDKNSAGSSINIVCGVKGENAATVSALLTESDTQILTNSDLPILAQEGETKIAAGDSNENAIFKNSNRIAVVMYNSWYPNGKVMFRGQVNRVSLRYGNGEASVELLVLSDGFDMNNFIARGYPFSYTDDVSQTVSNTTVTVTESSKGAGWTRAGQTWVAGASNLGAIKLRLLGTALVTVSAYVANAGAFLGSVSKQVSTGGYADFSFEFAQLSSLTPGASYFFEVSVAPGQSIQVKYNTTSVYANGSRWTATYSGGSGGGTYTQVAGDLYFVTRSGTPTTTTTYSSDDPVTEMMHGILADYNARGGYITERNFEATGLSLTYLFNQATIYDALKKILELSPTGFYSYVDLGTAKIDILQQSETADFTLVRGKDPLELNLDLTIEEVKNYLLFSGGEVSPGVNLYRDYQDPTSAALYGYRTVAKTDNRVTLDATADAIGESFIEESAGETQETTVTVSVSTIDHSLLIPGKTIGFRNYGSFIDSLILQIVRREFNTKTATLTLGQLPVRTSELVQRLSRELLNEQTINNPSAPS